MAERYAALYADLAEQQTGGAPEMAAAAAQ
jgi:hypothetical protein